MGIFRKPSGATAAQPINNLQVNSSANGIVIPVFGGTCRMPLWLLWNDDFKTITTTQKSGGGGIFGLSGSSSSNTTISYQTAFLAGLGWGTINHIANVWNGSGKVQAIQVTENFTVPPGGGSHTPTPPGGGGGNKPVRSVSFAQTFSQTFTDFGAPASTVLSGTFQAPMVQVASSPGAGQFTSNPTTGVTTFGAASAGLATQITYTVSFQTFTSMEEDTIPGGGTIQVPNSTQYAADGGVFLMVFVGLCCPFTADFELHGNRENDRDSKVYSRPYSSTNTALL
jgi:hypothetical protein